MDEPAAISVPRLVREVGSATPWGRTGDPVARYQRTLPTIFGGGSHRYQVVDNWARRRVGTVFGEVSGVAVDADDNVFVAARSGTVYIFNREGDFLDSWDANVEHGSYSMHGITIDRDGDVWLADAGTHVVRKFTAQGQLLLVLGTPKQNAPAMSGRPFNRPTRVAVAPNGDLYVSDGYANNHVHVFTAEGDYRFTFGGSGSGPRQFNIPHAVTISDDGVVYVCDRKNCRIQIFDLDGNYVTEWVGLHEPQDLAIGPDGTICVAEQQHRMSIWTPDGERITGWGDEECQCEPGGPIEDCTGDGTPAGMVICAHGVAVDSQGSLYVGELSDIYRGIDRGSRSVQKFVRAG